ncbi:MAG: cyclically-permuted mutarotase family protein [Porphyromonadaceae bacterium]|nr:cyclically-permuted mutarotase family protein [Porphyromonadaceae bacterium]
MYHSLSETVRWLIIASLAAAFLSCRPPGSDKNNIETMQVKWDKLSTKGLQGDLTKGVSAAYAALIDDKLIVGGGANFPGKQGFEGGSKTFYNQIMRYDEIKKEWKEIGQLPELAAYGVSVQTAEGALWIGGNNATGSLNNVYSVSLTESGDISLKSFPSLPASMDNFAGCASGDLIFVGGGNVNGVPSNAFFSINIKTDSVWKELPPFPGVPRVQPVMVSIVMEGKQSVYLLGGFFGGDATTGPTMATTILQYDVAAKAWTEAGIQTDPETGKPFSLGGATAMQLDGRYILCLGGVNYNVFLDAITTQYHIGQNPTLSPEEKQKQNLEFSKKYMTQPVAYYKFNRECRIFDTKTGVWSTIDSSSDFARAGATLVGKSDHFYAVQGELKPGVRSPQTFRGEIHFSNPLNRK